MEKSQCISSLQEKKKKNDKQCNKNYRPVSLLAVRSLKDFYLTKCICFLMKTTYYLTNQSCFRPGDSCINQLLSITHEIYQSFDNNLEVRGVFLGIFEVFDKIWHEGLILKLSRNDISGNLWNLLKDFLKHQKQKVLLNGQNSSWKGITSGGPQGSILGPLLFLIYINTLSDSLPYCKLFADDTSLSLLFMMSL